MAIRIKHLDLGTPGMRRNDGAFIGDHTAANKVVFVAPIDCVVNYVEVVSTGAQPPATTTASTTGVTLRLSLATATASHLGSRGTSATETNTNSISASVPYRIDCTANNSLTAGTALVLLCSAAGSGSLSQTFVTVNYTPSIHRNTR